MDLGSIFASLVVTDLKHSVLKRMSTGSGNKHLPQTCKIQCRRMTWEIWAGSDGGSSRRDWYRATAILKDHFSFVPFQHKHAQLHRFPQALAPSKRQLKHASLCIPARSFRDRQQCRANFVVSAGPEDRMDEEGGTEPDEPGHRRKASQTIREEFLKSLEVKAKRCQILGSTGSYGCSLVAQVNIPTIHYANVFSIIFNYCHISMCFLQSTTSTLIETPPQNPLIMFLSFGANWLITRVQAMCNDLLMTSS